jgi:hypothetical protein
MLTGLNWLRIVMLGLHLTYRLSQYSFKIRAGTPSLLTGYLSMYVPCHFG